MGRLGFGHTQAAAHAGVSSCRSEVVGVTMDCGLVCEKVGSFLQNHRGHVSARHASAGASNAGVRGKSSDF
jgi:hypothetical protein